MKSHQSHSKSALLGSFSGIILICFDYFDLDFDDSYFSDYFNFVFDSLYFIVDVAHIRHMWLDPCFDFLFVVCVLF